ncbi:universal stress protein [Massilia sp. UMI-21]|nr:universal stress protein [Massilia sp. UMI-21]
MYKRILVPTDGSAITTYAADAAIQLARGCGSELIALSVAYPGAYLGGVQGGLVSEAAPHAELLLKQADALADRVARRAHAAGVACTTATTYSLSPGDAIIEAAAEHGCDLIVMGSHGLRGMSHQPAGSVTQHVLAYSAVPVMVLRPARGASTEPGIPEGA